MSREIRCKSLKLPSEFTCDLLKWTLGREIPCKIPCSQGNNRGDGSDPDCVASQPVRSLRLVRQAHDNRAVVGLFASASRLWLPKTHDVLKFLWEVSAGIRRYSQIIGDAYWRLVRSSTAWPRWNKGSMKKRVDHYSNFS
jgi:hypothetical protein